MSRTRKSPWDKRKIDRFKKRYGYGKTVLRLIREGCPVPARLRPRTVDDWMQIVVVAPEDTEIYAWASKHYMRAVHRAYGAKKKAIG